MLNRRTFLQTSVGTIVVSGPRLADAATHTLTETRPSAAAHPSGPAAARAQFRWASEVRRLRLALFEFRDHFLPLLLDRYHCVGTFPNFMSYRATDLRHYRLYGTAIRHLMCGVPGDSTKETLHRFDPAEVSEPVWASLPEHARCWAYEAPYQVDETFVRDRVQIRRQRLVWSCPSACFMQATRFGHPTSLKPMLKILNCPIVERTHAEDVELTRALCRLRFTEFACLLSNLQSDVVTCLPAAALFPESRNRIVATDSTLPEMVKIRYQMAPSRPLAHAYCEVMGHATEWLANNETHRLTPFVRAFYLMGGRSESAPAQLLFVYLQKVMVLRYLAQHPEMQLSQLSDDLPDRTPVFWL